MPWADEADDSFAGYLFLVESYLQMCAFREQGYQRRPARTLTAMFAV